MIEKSLYDSLLEMLNFETIYLRSLLLLLLIFPYVTACFIV